MSMHYPTFWAFGDSITQGSFDPDNGCWGAHLSNSLVRKCDFIQRGFNGYTTRHFKQMIDKLFTAEDVKLCKGAMIFLGANDCILPGFTNSVPKEEYVSNLNYLIDYLTGLGIPLTKIILVSPPPYDWEKSGRGNNRSSESAAEYASLCAQVAQTRGCLSLNTNEELSKQNGWQDYFIDGLHFNRKGADAFFAILQPALTPIIGEIPQIGEEVAEEF